MSKLINDLQIAGMLAGENAVIADLKRKLRRKEMCMACHGSGSHQCEEDGLVVYIECGECNGTGFQP